ncbi:efflux RND transporter periplasmic adaptor subunit [Foetidibacter luteolus]|uniref:efflux RND transporter periplasmic adaptor subunit n=1 Tax=Foetidibacter luteolus TaxID=2608880 RepID=UPI001F215414|nr:efflux RND transporter periplasmic adaptor subunit [Foetidibacter luteolus]
MFQLHRLGKHLFYIPLVLSTACGSKKEPSAKPGNPGAGAARGQAVIVDVIVAKATGIENFIEANGTVLPNEFAELRPEINGRITYLNVPEGSFVAQGAVIARINDADLQANLGRSKAQLDLAAQTEQRLKKLLDINGVNQADYDLALNNLNTIKADIEFTQAQIDKSVVRAPFSGVIGLKQVSPGAFVTPANIIATIQQVSKLKVDFTLPEEYGAIVKKGAYVDVEVDAATKAKRKALIIASEPQANQTTRNLRVRALLEGGSARPGAFVKVLVNAGADKKAIMVPSNCIIPDDKNKQLVLVKNGKALFANVKTGVRLAETVEVTSGVNPGDSVVVTGVLFARPNAELKVRSVKALDSLAKQ